MTVPLRDSIRRVHCPSCEGVKTEQVPWAASGSSFTDSFEERIVYLAHQSIKTAVSELMRIAWRSVGRVISRVVSQKLDAGVDRLEGLRHIGIDELS